MKDSYKKIFLFDIYLLIILLVNSFVKIFLNDYMMVIFLIIVLFFFNIIFVFEKSRFRYVKDIILEFSISLLLFFLLYYLLGLIIGFYRIDNYYNLNGLFKFILPLVLTILLKEFLRFQIINKIDNNNLLYIITVIIFIFIDITNVVYYSNLKSIQSLFILIALTILPAITNNVFLTYVSKNVGYLPCIFYLLVMNLYQYLIPIIPNPNRYLVSVINFLFPILLFINIRNHFKRESDMEIISRDNRYGYYVSFFITAFIILIMVYFNSGYFFHVSIAVASDSMYPVIKKGDVVIIKKEKNEKKIVPNNIIAYKYSDVIIVHRIEKKEAVGDKYYYYTKGDANVLADEWVIDKESIIGKVVFKIPYLGIPTIWLRET